jgi:Ion channel
MTWLATSAGVVLVLVAWRDIFHTLWHPSGMGTVSRAVFRVVWRGTKLASRGHGSTELAGPLALLGSIVVWTMLTVIGFALVYLPHMPQGFYFGSSLEPARSSDLVASLYLSMVALATLGLGDVLPATPVLRVVVPLEALGGFLLLTAGISWVLQLYPALVRRRALARSLTSMARCGTADVVATGDTSVAVAHLEGVRNALAGAEMDLLQYAESYYFRESRPDTSLAAALPFVQELVAAGQGSTAPEVRNAASMLADALDELSALLRRDFLGPVGDRSQTLAAFAEDHQQAPVD